MKKKLPLFLCVTILLSTVHAQFIADRAEQKATFIQSSPLPGFSNGFDENKSITSVEKLITGSVTDDSRNPVFGVSVSIRGTTIGTTTDASGKFSLTVPDERLNDSLLVSSIGYEDKQVAIAGQDVVNVVLTQNVSNLNQVVVVGYGTQKRVAVTAVLSRPRILTRH